ncbi:MAG: adenylate/guanylate cyclase domain-containing protein [Halofilum sp. (in: g-proteobacteria)]|nr:adenylate/guanylate cyclase domain-containing protein [Halofilum sp. (in: g-proteobacteria)]
MQAPGPVATRLARYILRARREVTVLFTDIEGSTRYWDRHGDLEGRLMIDRHNRLTFPVVRHYRGRIVKTIGDSIMAVFRRPEDALQAAIAIQQVLAARRRADPAFDLHVRIGMHTGTAVVERRDVFGDVVNVAARVESHASGDEILVSGSMAMRLPRHDYALEKRADLRAKGKRRVVPVWQCDWVACRDHSADIRLESLLPLAAPQKATIAVYAVIGATGLYLLYHWYGRYVLSDWEWIALLALNPVRALQTHWYLPLGAAAITAALAWLLKGVRSLPLWSLHLAQGGAGLTLGLLLGATLGVLPWPGQAGWWREPLYASDHLFVEVRVERTPVRAGPDLDARPLLTVGRGELMLLADVSEGRDGIAWNRVLVGPGAWGWVPRVLPPALGHEAKRITWADKFYFRRGDAYTAARCRRAADRRAPLPPAALLSDLSPRAPRPPRRGCDRRAWRDTGPRRRARTCARGRGGCRARRRRSRPIP